MTDVLEGTPPTDVSTWHGRDVVDPSGSPLGTCSETYADAGSGQPEWLLVARTDGSFRIVPVAGAQLVDNVVHVAYGEYDVVTSPGFGAVAVLTETDETTLYRHYRLDRGSNAPAGVHSSDTHTSTLAPLLGATVLTLLAWLLLRRRRP